MLLFPIVKNFLNHYFTQYSKKNANIWIKYLLLHFFAMTWAQGMLQVYPTRIELGVHEAQRVASLNLKHADTTIQTYSIKAVYYEQLPDGQLRLVEDDSKMQDSATDLFRFSPKKITLHPDESQTVRLMLKHGQVYQQKQYRAHLLFINEGSEQAIPYQKDIPQTVTTKENGITTKLNIRISVSIPVIINVEPLVSSPGIEKIHFANNQPSDSSTMLEFDLVQRGAGYLYGDIVVTSTHPKIMAKNPLFMAKGISSYVPSLHYTATIPMSMASLTKNKADLVVSFLQAGTTETLTSQTWQESELSTAPAKIDNAPATKLKNH